LIKAQVGGFVHGPGVTAGTAEVFLCASSKESAGLMVPMESGEIEVTTVHDVKGTRLPASWSRIFTS
jgi:hypothetical protein